MNTIRLKTFLNNTSKLYRKEKLSGSVVQYTNSGNHMMTSNKPPQEIKRSLLSPESGIYSSKIQTKHAEWKNKPATYFGATFKKSSFSNYKLSTALSCKLNS
jgi:hypothetical protein